MKDVLAVLVSGGRSSARMARHIQTSPKYDHFEKVYIFCNTSQERPQTIEFLKAMVDHWDLPINLIEGIYSGQGETGISHRIVDFNSLRMDGSIFSEMIAFYNKNKMIGVPGPQIPYCSDRLKARPAHSFMKEIFGTHDYTRALGYRLEDMPKRITFAELRIDKKRIAPLITDFKFPCSANDVADFFKTEQFDLTIPSSLGNCELCWKKSDAKLVGAIRYGTRFIGWHSKQESIYGNRFFRENKSIEDLVLMAQSSTQIDAFDQEGDSCVCSFN